MGRIPNLAVREERDSMDLAIHTLGCKLNQAESAAIATDFEQSGFQVTALKEGGDVVLINSCTVTETADQECRKLVRRALRANPEAYVIVTGCYAQLRPEEVASIEGVDLVLGSAEKWRALELAGDMKKRDTPFVEVGDIGTSLTVGPGLTRPGADKTRAFLKVQDGCDYTCSFCTIPKARGVSRSLPTANVLKQAKTALMNGFREIVLTGVNLGDFGRKDGTTFYALLESLLTLRGLQRLKISSIEPNLLTDAIIDLAASDARLLPHFHIPLQSGSDAILGKMRRRYQSSLYAERVHSICEKIPHAAIGVDVISGFPGETDQHFLETVRFLEDLPVAYLHPFTYSERADTPAAEMDSAVRRQERSRRTGVLRNLSEKKAEAFAWQQQGTVRPVLFESFLPDGRLVGWTDNYIKVSLHDPTVGPGDIRMIQLGNRSHGITEGWIVP